MVTSTNVKNNLSVVTEAAAAKSKVAAGAAAAKSKVAADAAAAKSKVAAESVAVPEPAEFANLDAPELYLNRELTWLEFNRRVLHEAQDETNPLLERLKFVGIVSSNLDEFFMKRIGGLKLQVGAGIMDYSVDGRLPAQQIEESYVKVRELEELKSELVPHLFEQLAEHDIHVTPYEALSDENKETIRRDYFENIYPLVTPQGVDSAHPFPFISNLSLNLLVTLRNSDSDEEVRARVKVPVGLGIPRFLQVPDSHIFVPLESVMAKNLDVLFPKMVIVDCELFYVTRNANTARDEDQADDLLAIIESEPRNWDSTRPMCSKRKACWQRVICSASAISKCPRCVMYHTTRSITQSWCTCRIYFTRCETTDRSCCNILTNRFQPRLNDCCARRAVIQKYARSR
jgi:polyphosphate kinase